MFFLRHVSSNFRSSNVSEEKFFPQTVDVLFEFNMQHEHYSDQLASVSILQVKCQNGVDLYK